MLNFFTKRKPPLTFETLVELKLLTKEEMLLLKKERAIKEWEKETKGPVKARKTKL